MYTSAFQMQISNFYIHVIFICLIEALSERSKRNGLPHIHENMHSKKQRMNGTAHLAINIKL